MDPGARHDTLGNVAEMAVMGQIDDLTDTADIAKKPENLLRAGIVKRFHDIVGNEGHGRSHLGELFVSREPEREIELEPGSCR
jgi:hypothetical protein